MNTKPQITITTEQLAWENFPAHTNDAIEQHLDAHPPKASVWGSITKEDGTAGFLLDLDAEDILPVVRCLNTILFSKDAQQ